MKIMMDESSPSSQGETKPIRESRVDPRARVYKRLVLWGILAFSAWVLYQTPCIPTYRSSGSRPLSFERAQRRCPIRLPSTAQNVQYKHFSFLLYFAESVRFEAPVADCLAHIRTVIEDHNARYTSGLRQTPIKWTPITTPPSKVQLGLDVPWFDIHNIQSGIQAGARGTIQPAIWVDAERGVFYYMMTD